MTPAEAFGKIINQTRKERSLSQEYLAFHCGLDRTFVSMLERGKRQPSLETILKISAVLDVPAHVLVRQTTDLLTSE